MRTMTLTRRTALTGLLGGAALALDAAGAPIAESVTADQATAVYAMLAVLPWPTISSFLAAIVVIIFFVSFGTVVLAYH